MFRVGIFGVLILAWVFLELALRKKQGVHPQNFRELLKYAQKRTSPSPRWPPLLFALLTTLIFSFWEGFLRALLESEGPVWLGASGFALLVVFSYRRLRLWKNHEHKISFTQKDLLFLLLGTALFLPSLSAVFLSPWIYLRSRHLRRS